jgi:hypothetical protein
MQKFAKLTRRLGVEYNGHEGWPAGFEPLLVVDVWERTRFMRDYKVTERGKVIDEAFFPEHRLVDDRAETTRNAPARSRQLRPYSDHPGGPHA